MTITLTPEQEQRIKEQLASGSFSNESDVLDEALDLLERQRTARKRLQADIQEGLDDLAAGQSHSYTQETLPTRANDIKQRGRSLKAKRTQTIS